jgi:hypothetical protein
MKYPPFLEAWGILLPIILKLNQGEVDAESETITETIDASGF